MKVFQPTGGRERVEINPESDQLWGIVVTLFTATA